MPKLPKALQLKLDQRLRNESLRELKTTFPSLTDFASNDYLGLSQLTSVEVTAKQILKQYPVDAKPGSRLLTGNSQLHNNCEDYLAHFYQAESALLFNSGYTANLGLISAIGLRRSLILFDELVHASIRDGISLAQAKSYKFKHNNLVDLERKLQQYAHQFDSIYVITESVFSMDGDQAPVEKISALCKQFNAHFILDEAHAIGVLGKQGLSFQDINCLARVITFGKSFAQHGAVILGSEALKSYLVNFSRSLIYTTAISTRQTALIWAAHQEFKKNLSLVHQLQTNIALFLEQVQQLQLEDYFITSQSAIQSCIISGNSACKNIAEALEKEQFDVRAILSPTVPKGKERLRFCLHAYNSTEEIKRVLALLKVKLASIS
ncbi:MAG: aminotransferase class I/II-fold pyridoxal phosphate-dependent enzyme [Psychroflexus salarius]